MRLPTNNTPEIEALQELSMGKTTTLPDRYTREGIFFTRKAVHLFGIRSGSLHWLADKRRSDTAVGELGPPSGEPSCAWNWTR